MSSIIKLFLTLKINFLNTALVRNFYKLCSFLYNRRRFSKASFNSRSFSKGCLSIYVNKHYRDFLEFFPAYGFS